MLILIIGLIILAGIAMAVGVLHNRQIQKKIESGELKTASEIHYRAQRAEHVRHLERRDDRMAQFGRQIGIPFDLFQKDTPGQDFGRGHV